MTMIDSSGQRGTNVNPSVRENSSADLGVLPGVSQEQRSNLQLSSVLSLREKNIHSAQGFLDNKYVAVNLVQENFFFENHSQAQNGIRSEQNQYCSECSFTALETPQSSATNGFVEALKNFTTLLSSAGEAVFALLRNPTDADTSAFATQTEKPTTVSQTPTSTNSIPLTFSEKMKLMFSNADKRRVSEQEIRRGIITYQLYQKDPKLAESFQSYYDDAMRAGNTKDLSLQKALIHLIEDGKLPRSDASWVYSLSFRASQLDKNENKVSSKTTIGHGKSLQEAISIAEANLVGIQNGSITVKPLTL